MEGKREGERRERGSEGGREGLCETVDVLGVILGNASTAALDVVIAST